MSALIRSRVMVKLRDWSALAQTLADCGVYEWHADLGQIRWLGIAVPQNEDPDAFRARLAGHPNVEVATFDTAGDLCASYNASPTDTFIAPPGGATAQASLLMWHHSRINSYRAWKLLDGVIGSRGSAQIRIGLTDTGYEPGHPDLPAVPPSDQFNGFEGTFIRPDTGQPYTYVAGWGAAPDRIPQFEAYSDEFPEIGEWVEPGRLNGHGSMVLGITSTPHNGTGTAGVAPGCRPIVMSATGVDEYWNRRDVTGSGIARCFVEAADAGIEIASASCRFGRFLGWPGDVPPDGDESRLLYDACKYAKSSPRTLIVAAAGNDYENLDTASIFPAEGDGVLCVGALDANGGRIPYSNYGASVDILAPTNCGTPLPAQSKVGAAAPQFSDAGALYWSGTGTSSATPTVSGCVALAWSMNPSLTRQQILDIILSTVSPFLDADCETIYYPGNNKFGYKRGVVNAGKATTKAKATRFVGAVFPYVGFLGLGYTKGEPVAYGDPATHRAPQAQTVWHEKDESGNVRTRLDGTVWVELGGYSQKSDGTFDPVTHVELWVGNTRVHSGAPGYFQASAISDGQSRAVKAIAYTQSGKARQETYVGDYVVASLTSASFTSISPPAVQVASLTGRVVVGVESSHLSGDCAEGATVTANGLPVTIAGTSWSFSVVTPPPGVVESYVISDGTDSLTLTVQGEIEIPGSADAHAAGAAAMTVTPPVPLAGAAAGHAGGTSPLSQALPIAAAAGGHAGASAPNPANVRPPGSAGGDAEGQGTLTVQPPLGGAAAGHAAAQGTLSQLLKAPLRVFEIVAGAEVLSFGVRPWTLTAQDGTGLDFALAPSGYFGPAVDLAGGASGHAGASAIPGVVQGLAGSASGHAAAGAAATDQGLGAGADGHASAAGRLAQAQPLSGEAGGAAGATATGLQLPVMLSGEAAGQGGAAGTPGYAPLDAKASGQAGAVATLSQEQALSGQAQGQAAARLSTTPRTGALVVVQAAASLGGIRRLGVYPRIGGLRARAQASVGGLRVISATAAIEG